MMPDIAPCRNETRPLREKCYRYLADPDPHHQDYAHFKYSEKEGCEGFIKCTTDPNVTSWFANPNWIARITEFGNKKEDT